MLPLPGCPLTKTFSYLNEVNLEYDIPKTHKTVELAQLLIQQGAPIDGVGLQGHLLVGETPSRSALVTVMERFTSLGLEVAYTEVDIRHTSLPASAAALAQQGDDYAAVVGSCLDVPACVGVTVWGHTDRYSWIPGVFNGEGDALLYDANYNKKPAWTSVSSILAAAATPGPTTISELPTSEVTTQSTTTLTSSSTVPTPTPTGTSQTRWGQCGGRAWTGPVNCESPWTCQQINEWYSQCL